VRVWVWLVVEGGWEVEGWEAKGGAVAVDAGVGVVGGGWRERRVGGGGWEGSRG